MNLPVPVDLLEERAAEERRNLRRDLKNVKYTWEHKLNIKQNLREHLWQAAGISALVSGALGYAAAGLLTGRRND
jgi:hypothetical protein